MNRWIFLVVFLAFFSVTFLDGYSTYLAVSSGKYYELNHDIVNQIAWASFVVAIVQGIVLGLGFAFAIGLALPSRFRLLRWLVILFTIAGWLLLLQDRWNGSIRLLFGM